MLQLQHHEHQQQISEWHEESGWESAGEKSAEAVRGASRDRGEEQQGELPSVCCGLIRVIISLSLLGLFLSWAARAHALKRTFAFTY